MISPLVVTKCTPPPPRSHGLVRKQLLEYLLPGLERKLTLISAPAGFGKSTAAAELVRFSGRQGAWLSLERADNDPARWGAYLVEAFRQSGLPVGDQVQALLRFDAPFSLEPLMAALINVAAASSRPMLLVLDDYHHIETSDIHEAVAFLLNRMPPNFHLVIATRTRPPLPLARLKASRDITEVTAADLRFTPEEATVFLGDVMALELPPDGVTALVTKTEGWVAGLQLAALSLEGTADWKSGISRFDGRNPDLLDYLLEEVFHKQPIPVRTFLLHTAILARLNGPLCDAVTGLSGSHRMLQALEAANLFLFPLDSERTWYRYHALFGEFLAARLTQLRTGSSACPRQRSGNDHM